MSDTLTSYLISVAILCALALSIPCIESLARLLGSANRSEEEVHVGKPKSSASSHEAA